MRRVSENDHDEHRYDDMLKMERPVSKNHRHMDKLARAAQFAPFAALTGYNESIENASEIFQDKEELSESQIEDLNEKIKQLEQYLPMHPLVMVRYYTEPREVEHEQINLHSSSSQKRTAQEQLQYKKSRRLQETYEEEARAKAHAEKQIKGEYAIVKKQLHRIDRVHQVLVFTDRTTISFQSIAAIDCTLFKEVL